MHNDSSREAKAGGSEVVWGHRVNLVSKEGEERETLVNNNFLIKLTSSKSQVLLG